MSSILCVTYPHSTKPYVVAGLQTGASASSLWRAPAHQHDPETQRM